MTRRAYGAYARRVIRRLGGARLKFAKKRHFEGDFHQKWSKRGRFRAQLRTHTFKFAENVTKTASNDIGKASGQESVRSRLALEREVPRHASPVIKVLKFPSFGMSTPAFAP